MSVKNAATMSVNNQLVVAENKFLIMGNEQLRERLKAAENRIAG